MKKRNSNKLNNKFNSKTSDITSNTNVNSISIISDKNTDNLTNNKLQKLTNFFLKHGTLIISIIVGLIGLLSIFITAYFNSTFYHPEEKTSFKFSFGIIEIVLTIFVTILILIINRKILKKIPSTLILIPISIVSLILYFYWVNALKLNPETDQKLIHEMALTLLSGNIGNYNDISQYLFLYPYQFALTFVISLIYKIFGENFLYVQYLNCICSFINMFLIFYISKIIFKKENIQKILALLIGGFSLYWMFFNVHFYGNIIGLTLALTSILFTLLYLDKRSFYFLIPAGIFSCLAILIKTNYFIFLCAIILILLLDIIKKWNYKFLLIFPIFIFSFFIINFGYKQIVKYYNINDSSGVPMINYIYMGMAPQTSLSPGWYTGDNVKIYTDSNFNKEKNNEIVSELISNRLNYFIKNPKEFLTYYAQKIGSTWLNPTFQTIWCSLPGTRYRWYPEYAHYLGYHEKVLSMVGGNLYKIEENYCNIYQILIFIFASLGIFKIKSNTDNLKLYLIPITFLGGFLFHILWETKAIYVVQYYFILLPYSAFGIDYLYEKLFKTKIKKSKQPLKNDNNNNDTTADNT